MTSIAEVGPVLHHRGAHAGVAPRPGVGVLGVAVDAEQPGVALRAPHDQVERRAVVGP